MVEERKRRSHRERIEPERQLGQLDGHFVEVHAKDRALHDHPLEQVDVGKLLVFELQPKISHLLLDLFANFVEGIGYGLGVELGDDAREILG